jgi:hypothetical protein
LPLLTLNSLETHEHQLFVTELFLHGRPPQKGVKNEVSPIMSLLTSISVQAEIFQSSNKLFKEEDDEFTIAVIKAIQISSSIAEIFKVVSQGPKKTKPEIESEKTYVEQCRALCFRFEEGVSSKMGKMNMVVQSSSKKMNIFGNSLQAQSSSKKINIVGNSLQAQSNILKIMKVINI